MAHQKFMSVCGLEAISLPAVVQVTSGSRKHPAVSSPCYEKGVTCTPKKIIISMPTCFPFSKGIPISACAAVGNWHAPCSLGKEFLQGLSFIQKAEKKLYCSALLAELQSLILTLGADPKGIYHLLLLESLGTAQHP